MAEDDESEDLDGPPSLGHDPFADDASLFAEVFGGPSSGRPRPPGKPKPTHYKVVSFSMYHEDIAHLEDLVARLKAKGHSKANKSQVVRYALAMVDIEKMPRTY
jgi:hypothetical protein